jgi:hypothetical protein
VVVNWVAESRSRFLVFEEVAAVLGSLIGPYCLVMVMKEVHWKLKH